jgi:hypothetical protein
MPIPFACDDVPVIPVKRTRNARRRWLCRRTPPPSRQCQTKTHGDKWSVAWGRQYRIAYYRVMGGAGRAGIRAFRPLCRLYVMSTWSSTRPSLRTLSPWTISPCASIGPPWTPGKEAAETVKPFRTRTSRSARITISSLLEPVCTCHCAEMTRRIDAEPTAVNDKK